MNTGTHKPAWLITVDKDASDGQSQAATAQCWVSPPLRIEFKLLTMAQLIVWWNRNQKVWDSVSTAEHV